MYKDRFGFSFVLTHNNWVDSRPSAIIGLIRQLLIKYLSELSPIEHVNTPPLITIDANNSNNYLTVDTMW